MIILLFLLVNSKDEPKTYVVFLYLVRQIVFEGICHPSFVIHQEVICDGHFFEISLASSVKSKLGFALDFASANKRKAECDII